MTESEKAEAAVQSGLVQILKEFAIWLLCVGALFAVLKYLRPAGYPAWLAFLFTLIVMGATGYVWVVAMEREMPPQGVLYLLASALFWKGLIRNKPARPKAP